MVKEQGVPDAVRGLEESRCFFQSHLCDDLPVEWKFMPSEDITEYLNTPGTDLASKFSAFVQPPKVGESIRIAQDRAGFEVAVHAVCAVTVTIGNAGRKFPVPLEDSILQ